MIPPLAGVTLWRALRGRFDVVVARGFGPPPATAECGAPFLRVDGRLIVSDPPRDGDGEPGGGAGSGAGVYEVKWPQAGKAPFGAVVGRALGGQGGGLRRIVPVRGPRPAPVRRQDQSGRSCQASGAGTSVSCSNSRS